MERLTPGLPFSRRMDALVPDAVLAPAFEGRIGLSVPAAMMIEICLLFFKVPDRIVSVRVVDEAIRYFVCV